MNELILLVEDDATVAGFNERKLQRGGYRVLVADTLSHARDLLSMHAPDLIVLDVMLPDGDGFAFCRELRASSAVPVLFLTGRQSVADKVQGLNTGGDYYLTKPYDYEEFMAAVARLLRRDRDSRKAQESISQGSFELDLLAARAFYDNMDLNLSPKEFALLHCFLRRPGQVQPFDALYFAVWKEPLNGNLAVLRRTVSKLRTKLLDASNQRLDIAVRRGEGYELTGD